MPHFYVHPSSIRGKRFLIQGKDAHYLAHVRRCSEDSLINLFDGTGKVYAGKVDRITPTEISGTLLEEKALPPPWFSVHLFQSVPKGSRFDWLVEKSAELGVHTITPLITERSVMKKITETKIDRWHRLSKAASQQSGRATIMKIEAPARFTKAVQNRKKDSLAIIPWEGEDSNTIHHTFHIIPPVSNAQVFIGPEGGFSVEEIELARKNAIVPVTLGEQILRVETAGILSAILLLNCAGAFSFRKDSECR